MGDTGLRWVVVDSQGPEWSRSAAIDGDGTVFAPAVLAHPSEWSVMLCAAFDGVPMFKDHGHVYVPVEWMGREYPHVAPLCRQIADRIKDHLGVVGLGQ